MFDPVTLHLSGFMDGLNFPTPEIWFDPPGPLVPFDVQGAIVPAPVPLGPGSWAETNGDSSPGQIQSFGTYVVSPADMPATLPLMLVGSFGWLAWHLGPGRAGGRTHCDRHLDWPHLSSSLAAGPRR